MEPSGLTSLPVELIHHIARYLPAQDVLSCSLTCHYLRNTLNDNSVWNKYLPQRSSYLDLQEQLVYPTFYMEDSLALLCKDRQYFAKMVHVINNWRTGNYLWYKLKSEPLIFNDIFNLKEEGRRLFYGDNYVFLGHYNKDRDIDICAGIEVWDISNAPVICNALYINENITSFFIVDSYLVVVKCNKVYVHYITLPKTDFPMEYSFLVTDEIVNVNGGIEHCNTPDGICELWNHVLIKHYFISHKLEDYAFHIWNIKSASKIGYFSPGIMFTKITKVSYIKQHILFLFATPESDNCKMIFFDITKLQFNNSMLEHTSCLFFTHFSKYIILFKIADNPDLEGRHHCICSIHDLNSSLILKERTFDSSSLYYMLCNIIVVNGRFLMQCSDCLHIVDALSLETVDKIEDYKFCHIVKQIDVYKSLVIVVKQFNTNSTSSLEFWDVYRKNKLPISIKIKTLSSRVHLNSLCTKLCVISNDHVNVVNFW